MRGVAIPTHVIKSAIRGYLFAGSSRASLKSLFITESHGRGKIETMRARYAASWLAASFFVFAPPILGQSGDLYRGTVVNSGLTSMPATLEWSVFARSDSQVVGWLQIGAPLGGTGITLAMPRGQDSVVLVTLSEAGDTIVWTSPTRTGMMSGSYSITGGQFRGQGGQWSLEPSSSEPKFVIVLIAAAIAVSILAVLLRVAKFATSRLWGRRFAAKLDGLSVGETRALSGVGGWLAWFVAGNTILVLYLLGTIGEVSSNLGAGSWMLNAPLPGVRPVLLIESSTHLLQLMGAVVGLVLILRSSALAPMYWVCLLITVGALALFDIGAASALARQSSRLLILGDLSGEFEKATTSNLKVVLSSLIWSLYWVRSKRVRVVFDTASHSRPAKGPVPLVESATVAQPNIAEKPAETGVFVNTVSTTARQGPAPPVRNEPTPKYSQEISNERVLTDLERNAFAILGAGTRDDRRRIVELAEAKSLHLDDAICQKARADLTNPRTRLAVEVAWLPGVSPNRAEQLLSHLSENSVSLANEVGLPALAKANLMSAAFQSIDAKRSPHDMAGMINDFAKLVDELSVVTIARDINEDRFVSGFPAIDTPESVSTVLDQQKRRYRDAVKAALNTMAADDLVIVMTNVVDRATCSGTSHASSLIDELVDSYELEARNFFDTEAESIAKLAGVIREQASMGEAGIQPLVDKLLQVVRNWDRVAQPVQLSMRARGIAHRPSLKVASDVRNLGVDLWNDHDMLSSAERITGTLGEVFSELPTFMDTLMEDAATISRLADTRKQAESTRAKRDAELTYEAEIGMIFKDRLRISPEGIVWRGTRHTLDSITRVRWGGVKHSVNGVPTGTTYTIAFGDSSRESVVELRREDIYGIFLDKLWRAVCVRLIVDTLRGLNTGRQFTFGDAVIADESVTLMRHRFLRRRESVRYGWDGVTVSSIDGCFQIQAKDDSQTYVRLPYIHVPNVHLLEHIIRWAFKEGASSLSDVLKD